MPNIILINSNDNNPFVAFSGKKYVIASFAREYSPEGENNLRKLPDKLIQCLKKIRDDAGDDYMKADTVAVTVGPGSFTGIRVGISIAKGIAFALGIKIIPINNFELIYTGIPDRAANQKYCILLPAKEPEYYYCIIKENKETGKGCLKIMEIPDKLDSGTVIAVNFSDETLRKLDYFELLNVNEYSSELNLMVKLAREKFRNGNVSDAETIEPLYLKEPLYKKI
jgi:tRNA threonylcarbamoyladenosine biosynthesis protein TsaB